MKADELLKHAECSLCRRKIGHTGLPCFWIVKIERHGINLAAARRQDALGELRKAGVLIGPNTGTMRPAPELLG